MQKLPEIDQDYMISLLQELLSIPSPTGYTEEVVHYLEQRLTDFPFLNFHRTTKGALISQLDG